MSNLPAKIENKLAKIADRRSIVLASYEVREKLRNTEIMILEAGTITPIVAMTSHELAEDIKTKVMFLARDVGIKGQVDNYSMIRFIDILQKYYSNLTTSEVKLAFELVMIGELDDYLPLDKNGQPDRNHYQEFSLEYQTKILNAYKRMQSKTWNKAIKELPVHEVEITMEEKDRIHTEFLESLVTMFDKYRDKGVKPIIPLPFLILNELRKSDLLHEEPVVDNEDIQQAFDALISSDTDYWTKRRLAKQFREEGVANETVIRKAETDKEYQIILEVFDELIEKKENLKDKLKW